MTTVDAERQLAALDESGASLASVFEKQVTRYPDRMAVVGHDGRLTYAELNQAADRIAQLLLARLGSGETTVALLFQPSTSIVAAILGVLKAGKIYIALDPSYPQPRTAYMLDDCEAKLLLTNTRYFAFAKQLARGDQEVVNCDEIDPSTAIAKANCSVNGNTAALLLYTSGSTGKPRGVLHNHRNLLIEARNYTSDAHICPDDRLAVWHSFSFANSIRNLFGAVLNGAAVFPYDLPAQGLMPLGKWIRKHEVTMIHTLATTFRAFVDTLPGNATFSSVRILRLGGEPIHSDDVKKFMHHFPPPCVLMHVMGPTETLSIRRHFISHDWNGGAGKLPVGYPVPDKEVLLLDETGRQVAPNETGEIVVRSKYLAVGYWRQPQLTQAAFLPDPEGGEERIYYTGDLGVMRPDGCLMHLGRKDFQVKVRGNRVEVAEIEMVLLEHSAVKDAVVVPREDQRGDTCLVAYVVPKINSSPSVGALQKHVRERLPDFMVPARCIFLEALPLTQTGKLDRRALLAITPVNVLPRQAYVAPRTPVEEKLTKIWAEVLRLDRVGIHDDFLALGGHSLLAMQVVTRVRDTLQLEVPSRTLLEAFTVAHMAVAIVQHMAGSVEASELETLLKEAEGTPVGDT